jgi:ABC-type sugar transport system permease subunit
MFELFKILCNVFVLREEARKGRMNWRVWAYGFGFAVLLYAIGLSAAVLYSNHPQYKPLFIAAMVLDGMLFAVFMAWAWRWRKQTVAQGATPRPEVVNYPHEGSNH